MIDFIFSIEQILFYVQYFKFKMISSTAIAIDLTEDSLLNKVSLSNIEEVNKELANLFECLKRQRCLKTLIFKSISYRLYRPIKID